MAPGMTYSKLAVALTTLSLLVGCGGPLDESDNGALGATELGLKNRTGSTAPSYASQTAAAESASPVWVSTFSASTTSNIYFATVITGTLSGHHTESVSVNLPGGSLYQNITVAFATDVAAGAGEVQAQKTSTGYIVWAAMPVAGTIIQQYNLSGPWTDSVYVDGAPAANASGSFTVQ